MFNIVKLNEANENPNYEIYILSFNNIDREKNMIRRFEIAGTHANLCLFKENNPNYPGISHYFSNPLAMIEYFYNHTNKPYMIFLENDVHLSKTFTKDLDVTIKIIEELNLDVLLIGYLINTHPLNYNCGLIKNNVYRYPDYLWGAQGFIITRNHAKFFLEYFTKEYILSGNTKETLSGDWVFTKMGNRALVYPPLCVEEGTVSTTHQGQINFHQSCKDFLFNDNYII